MRVGVFGLGYVGSVMMGCLSRAGHTVTGVDVQPERVLAFERGECHIVEPGLPELIRDARQSGRMRATTDLAKAVEGSRVSFVCVGTPNAAHGGLDVSLVETVVTQIAGALVDRETPRPHCIAIRSTVVPGTVARCVELAASASGLRPGQDFTVCVNPEFMREGSGVADFTEPPFTIVGAQDPSWAAPLVELYDFVRAPLHVTPPGVAEVLKMVCNAWHATKVSFANEIGRLCAPLGIDERRVMGLFASDGKLNLSAAYLRPGFAYGGSCLPKDLTALEALAAQAHVDVPLLGGVRQSNEVAIGRALDLITSTGCRRVAFLGLSFKPGTDDMRGSPLVELVSRCRARGLSVRAHDPCVDPSRIVGSNLRYITDRIGPLDELLVDTPDALRDHAEVFVLGHADASFVTFCRSLPAGRTVVDLVGACREQTMQARLLTLYS